MLTSFSLFSPSFVFYLVLALLFICIIYIFFEFGILGSQTHESQTRRPATTLACINPCNR